MRLSYWALPIAAALAYGVWRHYAALVYVGDLPPFDLHFYSYDQALTYLAGLGPAAKAVYLGPLHRADMALLLLLAATLMLPVWRLGWLWCLPALGYAGFDLLENNAVSGLLRHGLREAGEVTMVTALTGLKFAALAIAALVAAYGLWWTRCRRSL